MEALQHAEHKHPGWPTDSLRRAAILVEEAGEVLQATLNMIEHVETLRSNPSLEHQIETWRLNNLILTEVAQTGAMALRYLINVERELYAKTAVVDQRET